MTFMGIMQNNKGTNIVISAFLLFVVRATILEKVGRASVKIGFCEILSFMFFLLGCNNVAR